MSDAGILESLKEIRRLVDACIANYQGPRRSARGADLHLGDKGSKLGAATVTLTERILALKDEGFFEEPRSARDVHEKLRNSYACEPDRISMALLRLNHRKLIRKATKSVDDKTLLAYVW